MDSVRHPPPKLGTGVALAWVLLTDVDLLRTHVVMVPQASHCMVRRIVILGGDVQSLTQTPDGQ